jgi:hypothetical protein
MIAYPCVACGFTAILANEEEGMIGGWYLRSLQVSLWRCAASVSE